MEELEGREKRRWEIGKRKENLRVKLGSPTSQL